MDTLYFPNLILCYPKTLVSANCCTLPQKPTIPNWVIDSAKLGFTIVSAKHLGNCSSKCNISTSITKYNGAILQQHIGSNENYLLEETGKVW